MGRQFPSMRGGPTYSSEAGWTTYDMPVQSTARSLRAGGPARLPPTSLCNQRRMRSLRSCASIQG